MLEIKNLVKIYKTKGGTEVRALDNVSVKFPETGMVFLLGKSGSGKSTLLNVSGGLDKPDSGEIIIKGKNSKDFTGSDFDSYRNTYIGFIFQEYNILNEFNIEQNIELALQLQGKKNDKEAVNQLLDQVDLRNMAKRKPNTLSGGQKQRVAIARALIKNPEIIMADEPTGALDSNTGKQVFDTLKKLSETKLVIVVSHDRDFAEIYADRIIELADGKIISDVTKEHVEPTKLNDNINIINDNVLSIKNIDDLKREDLDKLYDVLKTQKGEVLITSDDNNLKSIKQAIHINSDNKSEVFNDTKEVNVKEYDGKKTKFIKSHLPLARAFKIGASSIKSKPVRMIFTVFLTLVALTMFGVVSTLMLYDANYSVSQALADSDNDYELINKSYKSNQVNYVYDFKTGETTQNGSYERYNPAYFENNEINTLNNSNNNLNFAGVFNFNSYNNALQFDKLYSNNKYYSYNYLYGFIDAGQEYMAKNNFNLIAGNYPTKPDEIAVSEYIYNSFKDNTNFNVNSTNDLIYNEELNNKFLATLRSNNEQMNIEFKITGIYNVGTIKSEYEELKKDNPNLSKEELTKLSDKYSNYMNYSYQLLGYVSKDFYDYYYKILKPRENNDSGYIGSVYARGIYISQNSTYEKISPDYGISYLSSEFAKKLTKNINFYNLNEEKISYNGVNNNQIYISDTQYNQYQKQKAYVKFNYADQIIGNYKIDKELYEFLNTNDNLNIYSKLNNKKFNGLNNEEYEKFLSFIDTYYPKIAKKLYIYQQMQNYMNQYNNEGYDSLDEEYVNVTNMYYEVNSEMYKTEGTPNFDLIDDNLNMIDSYLDDNKTLLEHNTLDNVFWNLYYNNSITSNEKNILEDLNLKKNNGEVFTEEDYNILKDIYVKYYKLEGYDSSNVIKTEELKIVYYYTTATGLSGELEVIGYYSCSDSYLPDFLVNDDFMKQNTSIDNTDIYYTVTETDYVSSGENKYNALITKTNFSQSEIDVLLKDSGTYKYKMTNGIYQQLFYIIELIGTLKKVFLIVGAVFAAFAALMLFNFISSSISSKTKEIGILRAVGARGSDLFKIFFSESGVLTAICIVLSIIISFVVCYILNNNLSETISLKLLNFGLINSLLIIGGGILIAIIGTFIPVLIASKKQPVDSIRTL